MGLLYSLGCFALAIYYWIESIVLFFVPARFREKSVAGEIALITGGGSGIGRLTALRLAKRGVKIVTWDVNEAGNEETVKLVREAGGEAHGYTCDLSKREDIYRMADKVKQDVGKVTLLINNAGMVTGKSLMDIPDHLITKTMEVNSLAHFWTTKAFLPDMLKLQKGHIVNIASLAGMCGMSRLTDYCASKFAAVGFHEALTSELMADERNYIQTTCICPFFISTGMFAGAQSKLVPFLTPEYVADRIVTAILLDERHVVIPGRLLSLLFLKLIFPVKSNFMLGKATEVNKAMDTFTGRVTKSK